MLFGGSELCGGGLRNAWVDLRFWSAVLGQWGNQAGLDRARDL